MDLQTITIQEIVAGIEYAEKVLESLEKNRLGKGGDSKTERKFALDIEVWTIRYERLINLARNRIDLIIK